MTRVALTALAVAVIALTSTAADARRYQHTGTHYTGTHHATHGRHGTAWCGLYLRSQVGGDPGPNFNLARNWAHWGSASSPGVGAVVVWAHHVGIIVGQDNGQWIMRSGNDGGRVRTRPLSMRGVIAIRRGGSGFANAYASAQTEDSRASASRIAAPSRLAAREPNARELSARGINARELRGGVPRYVAAAEVARYDRHDDQFGGRYPPVASSGAAPAPRRGFDARAIHRGVGPYMRRTAYAAAGPQGFAPAYR